MPAPIDVLFSAAVSVGSVAAVFVGKMLYASIRGERAKTDFDVANSLRDALVAEIDRLGIEIEKLLSKIVQLGIEIENERVRRTDEHAALRSDLANCNAERDLLIARVAGLEHRLQGLE